MTGNENLANCPGPESNEAGKLKGCAGCPNQKICAEGPKNNAAEVEDLKLILKRLGSVKKKIMILSGKGGVGKSTVTSQLAFAIASNEDIQVGVLDIDICGPSIPRMMGVEDESVHNSQSGWTPVYARDNLAVMSVGFLLNDRDSAVIWRGDQKNGMIKQFLRDVNWENLDILLIDTPPGTSDEHLSFISLMKECHIDGAVVVTTPQELSIQDVRKEIDFCKKVKLPLIGIVENMNVFVCPHCHQESKIFSDTYGGGVALSNSLNIPLLCSIPLDPLLARSCDSGESFIEKYPASSLSNTYLELASSVLRFIH